MGERVVLGRKGTSSMIKIQWTDKIPGSINDVEDAQTTESSPNSPASKAARVSGSSPRRRAMATSV